MSPWRLSSCSAHPLCTSARVTIAPPAPEGRSGSTNGWSSTLSDFRRDTGHAWLTQTCIWTSRRRVFLRWWCRWMIEGILTPATFWCQTSLARFRPSMRKRWRRLA